RAHHVPPIIIAAEITTKSSSARHWFNADLNGLSPPKKGLPRAISIGCEASRALRQTAPASDASQFVSVSNLRASACKESHNAGGPRLLVTVTEISLVPACRVPVTSSSTGAFQSVVVPDEASTISPLIRSANCMNARIDSVTFAGV